MNHMLSYNVTSSGRGESHSHQYSPFYNHKPTNTALERPLGVISPASMSGMLPNRINHLSLGSGSGGLYTPENTAYTLNNMLPSNAPVCPQRELFPASPMSSHTGANGRSIFGAGFLMRERLRWYELAQKQGFVVEPELERVRENSCRSAGQYYGRIAAHFRYRYCETDAKTKTAYLQIGVRVPNKDHVSEIVGKGGQKVKLIRKETGALNPTTGEHEEHVFMIEAPLEIAMRVAKLLTTRVQEITRRKLSAGKRRRGSTSSQVTGLDPSGKACGLLTTTNGKCHNTNGGDNGSGCVMGSAHLNSCGGGGGLLAPSEVCLG
ncbi:RNA binding protein MEX3B [Fasciola gigantica]|uniref:RNA binding protein MEX3B n=1 Tax=Fasciola gigantica TaxID=46835 RepID=A0A504YZI8_FASGI|nr:RNA binding protein MEX3B [Fasciola gigantica]